MQISWIPGFQIPCPGNKNAPAAGPPERLKFIWPSLADLGAQETAMIFYPHSTAAEQIGDGGDGFTAAFGAGTDGENQITEGKLLWAAQNLRVLVHHIKKDSTLDANVQK